MRILSALVASSALALAGCTSLLGDFAYDPNGDAKAGSASGGSGAGGKDSGGAAGMQGDIVVMPTKGLITTEQGAKATFSMVLRRQPTENVAIALSSSNEKEGTVSPNSVTFTPVNWAAPQLVQVTGVDDTLADGTQTYWIKTSPASSEDPSYVGIDPVDPEVKNIDDETAGFLLMPPSGLVTTESGGEATFTLALTHAPGFDVIIPLSSDNLAEGTVSPASLTFTPVNWMAPQVVTVTGVDDDVADGPQTFHVVTGAASSNDTGYDKLDPDDETVINQDNDSAGITLSPQTGLVTFEKDNAMTAFGIVLNSPPSKDVTIGLSSSNEGEGTVEPDHVTFTPLNWMAPQLVTVTGVDDDRADGNQPYHIITAPCVSDDPGYSGLDGPDADLINVDDDSPGLVVTPMTGLTTSEDGASATFTVTLQSKPNGAVTLDVVSSRPSEGVATPAALAFTEVNWNAPQTVTITGVDDKMADGMQPYVVHVTPDASSADSAYAALNPVDVSVSNTDNDSAGITVMAGQGLTTTEAGGTATFTIALNSQPNSDVSITLTSSDASEGTVSPAKLVFTKDNYNAPQKVTVKGVNDDMQDGNQPYHIITEAAVSADPGYSGMNASNVDLTNIDDDSAGITVSAPNQPLMTSESGGTATFTVVLNTQPAAGAEVNIPVQSSNTAEGTVNVSNLKFTGLNWNAPQAVTVKGVDDDVADGSQQYQVWLLLATSTDPNYRINPPNVNVINIDNDSPGISLRNATNLTTKEDGSMATFQLVLNSKPTANVTIGLSSSKPGEGSVTPASVTFTNANWNAPQTVTVTGVDDKIADGSQVYRVITAAAVSTDPKYNGIDAADPQVTNIDNDSPGISVVFTPATGLVTKETGASATFSVTLNSQPTADVVIPVHSSKTSEGTVNPASLTFTAANYNAPHTVTVTGVDDKIADGAQPYSIVLDPATSSDANYNGLDAADVPASNIDNDSAGISVSSLTSANDAAGDTKERGGNATFTIALNSQPTADVTIALSSSDTTEGTVSPTSVTFTPANYAAPQKITITPVDDQVADGPQPYSIDIAPASTKDTSGYAGLDADDVTLINIDDDSAGITATITGMTSEAGGTATLSISLNSQPTADVTIPLSSSNTDEGTLAKDHVTFTSVDYASTQTVTITGVDDSVADGNQQYTIVIGAATSADKGYDKMDIGDLTVTNVDDDSAGLNVVAPVDPTTHDRSTSEKPGAAAYTFTIALTSKPSANVTVPLSSSDTTEGTVSPASLTFTTLNWNAAQTVTVTGVNDDVADGSQSYAIVIGAATSTDKGYSGQDFAGDIAMTNIDDDSPGFQISKPGSTSEDGTTTTFTIVLSSQPTADVTIPLSSSDTTEGTVTPASLVFTTADWNSSSKHTVTVHGEDDHIADGTQTFTIVTGPAVSADKGYNGLNPDDVDVKNTDNDTAGISVVLVSPADGATTEAGGVAKLAITLNSQPKAAVSIPVASSNTAEGVVDKDTVEFSTSDWNLPHPVTVTGVDDAVADGDQSYTILISKPTSTDTDYANIDPDDVTLINRDDDSAGIELSVTSKDVLSVSEDLTSSSFEVWLDSQPKANVVIPVSVSNPDEASVSPSSLKFTSTDWQRHQKVTVTGVDDDVADGPQDSLVILGVVSSTDADYGGQNPPDVKVTTLDNDSAFINLTPPAADMSSTGEAAGSPTVTFSVVLTSAPKSSVTIPLVSSNEGEGVITDPTPHKLVFDATNWKTPQYVTVVGVDDPDPDGDMPYVIHVGPSQSADSAYDAQSLDDIHLINVDDEPPP